MVNDTRDAVSPHKVLRNTIYNFNINIRGIGLPFNDLVTNINVEDVLTVNNWEKEELIDVDFLPKYFNIDRTYLGFQIIDKSLTSRIVTNVADWKLINAAGETMFSFAYNKIAPITINGITYTLSGNASVATITVTKAVSYTNFSKQKILLQCLIGRMPLLLALLFVIVLGAFPLSVS